MREFLLLVLLAIAIGWLVWRLRKPATSAKESTDVKETSIWHAVSIAYSHSACNAAKAMTGRRFLSSAAPQLPLPDCDAVECRCKFKHHDDRRSGRDRRSPFATRTFSGDGSGSFAKERRVNPGRREDDAPDDGY